MLISFLQSDEIASSSAVINILISGKQGKSHEKRIYEMFPSGSRIQRTISEVQMSESSLRLTTDKLEKNNKSRWIVKEIEMNFN